MANYFLKVDKDLFGKGLNPTEILLLAQIIEYNNTTGDFFMSDDALAEAFGVSESKISRTFKDLENKKLITRVTKNVKGGRERHVYINESVIQAMTTTSKMTFDSSQQPANCLLTTVILPIDNRQNDFIKDKEKDNLKDKKRTISQQEIETVGTIDTVTLQQVVVEEYISADIVKVNGKLWKIEQATTYTATA